VKFVKDAAELKAGDWFEVITPGAGGYGPPAERAREAVARDLAEGVIDAKTAREVYGFNPSP
jgi:N-methylhydantoinase B